jgi:hypothetical protein
MSAKPSNKGRHPKAGSQSVGGEVKPKRRATAHKTPTPTTEAGRLVGVISRLIDELSDKKGLFIPLVFDPMRNNPDLNPAVMAERLEDRVAADEKELWFDQIMVVAAYAAKAMNEEEKGNLDEAWLCVVNAAFGAGTLAVSLWRNPLDPQVMAHKGAEVRHATNRAMKGAAIADYLKNKDKYGSKDAAAEAIAGNVVPAKFRTVRDWLKNVRGASTA